MGAVQQLKGHGEGHVQIPALQPLQQRPEFKPVQGELHPAPAGMKPPRQRHDLRGHDAESAQSQPSVLPALFPLQGGPGRVHAAEDIQAVPIEAFSGRRQAHHAGIPQKQLCAQFPLQLVDMLADRALGDIQLLGRAGEGTVIGHGDKGPEQLAVHVLPLFRPGNPVIRKRDFPFPAKCALINSN